MKNECCIVRDLLPLYLEQMVSAETAEFLEEHLNNCPDCRAACDSMRQNSASSDPAAALQRLEEAKPLIGMKKKLRKRALLTVLLTTTVILAFVAALNTFPIHRVAQVWYPSYFTTGEISMLLYTGSPQDRTAAQSVLRQSEEAFCDLTHTDEENRERYGRLARYATDSSYNAVSQSHTLELWAAHFGASDGYMWVWYSQEAYDADGETVRGSWRIPSLWYVVRDESGNWVVDGIIEHP